MSIHCSKNINIMFISSWKLILSWQGCFNTTMTSVWLLFSPWKKKQFRKLKLYIYVPKDSLEKVNLYHDWWVVTCSTWTRYYCSYFSFALKQHKRKCFCIERKKNFLILSGNYCHQNCLQEMVYFKVCLASSPSHPLPLNRININIISMARRSE